LASFGRDKTLRGDIVPALEGKIGQANNAEGRCWARRDAYSETCGASAGHLGEPPGRTTFIPKTDEQLELFASPKHVVSEAMDKINDRWGEFVITPALMMGMDDVILDRIAFGGVKELQELYTE